MPGAGKTSVAAVLVSRYARAIHLQLDLLHGAGAASALPFRGRARREDPAGRARDRLLERHAVMRFAATYARAGVAVVIDDTLEDDAERRAYEEAADGTPLRLVHLAPPLAVCLARNATRANKPTGDAPMLEATARRLYRRMRQAHTSARGWYVLDTTGLNVEATVDAMVGRFGLSGAAR